VNPQYLYKRDWALTVGIGSSTTGNRYTGVRVVFDINKTSDSSSNKSKIEVYGLQAQTRQSYQAASVSDVKSALQVRLDAGYEGLVLPIYIGDVRLVTNRREAADVITTFECGTAEKQLLLTHYDQTYGKGTTLLQVIKDLASALQVDVAPVRGVPNATFNFGFAATGTVSSTLDRVTKSFGLQWSVQDGVLAVYPLGATSGVPTARAIVLSESTGLVGVPSKNEGNTGLTQFQSLLNPSLVPGTPVQIFSDTIQGEYFVIRNARFQGDTHGNNWTVDCQATRITVTQTTSANIGLGTIA